MAKEVFHTIRKFAFALVVFLSTPTLNAGPIEVVDTLSINESVQIGPINNCLAYFEGTAHVVNCRDGEVPVPAAIWLFLFILMAFVGLSNKRKL